MFLLDTKGSGLYGAGSAGARPWPASHPSKKVCKEGRSGRGRQCIGIGWRRVVWHWPSSQQHLMWQGYACPSVRERWLSSIHKHNHAKGWHKGWQWPGWCALSYLCLGPFLCAHSGMSHTHAIWLLILGREEPFFGSSSAAVGLSSLSSHQDGNSVRVSIIRQRPRAQAGRSVVRSSSFHLFGSRNIVLILVMC